MENVRGPTKNHTSCVEWLIYGSCAVFILVLGLSAAYDPSIRVLHGFQALIYVAVVLLARRRSAFGYGAGCLIAALWNWTNLVHTTFIRQGLDQLLSFLRTGRVTRPDLVISVFAAAAHFVLMGACLAGLIRLRSKKWRQIAGFLAGGAAAVAYFVAIILAFGPQYVPLLKRVVGIH